MIKSRAAVLRGLGEWRYEEIDIKNPSKDQAIIKISKSGICSTDVVRSMQFGFYSYPIVPGHEMFGYIYKLGSKTKNLKVLKLIVETMVKALKKNREVPYTKLLTKK